MIGVLAGGVGAARFLSGLVQVVPGDEVTAIVNVADDFELHGLQISPDLDTVTYTLAGVNDQERGWGLADETFGAMAALRRFDPDAWFDLGDTDLGTHLYRTSRLAAGATLAQVTDEIASAFGIQTRILPVTNDPVRTLVTLRGPQGGEPGPEVSFQEYFVARRHDVDVAALRFDRAAQSLPAPGVLETLEGATTVVVAPSNPLVSIDPVLVVPGVRQAVIERRDDVVAVSPIIAGRAVKGPADRLMAEMGGEPSVVGVARHYAALIGCLVIDEADRHLAADVEAEGVRCVVTPTIMDSPAAAASLASAVLGARR